MSEAKKLLPQLDQLKANNIPFTSRSFEKIVEKIRMKLERGEESSTDRSCAPSDRKPSLELLEGAFQ